MYHTTGKNMVYNKDEQTLTIDNGDGHMIIIGSSSNDVDE